MMEARSQLGVRGDFAAACQPLSRSSKFVLMFRPAMLYLPNSPCYALLIDPAKVREQWVSRFQFTFDTQAKAMVDWPQRDLINWVEWRIRAFEVARENEKKKIGSEPPDHPLSELDLRIWLASVKGTESQSAIARKLYRKDWVTGTGKRKNPAAISRIRRSIARVEKYLNRGEPEFFMTKKQRKEFNEVLRRVLWG